MTRTNEHGQPVGRPVAWSGAPAPERVRLEGRYVVVEPVAPAHAGDLFDSVCGADDAPLWTYRADDPPPDPPAMRARVEEWCADPVNLTYALVPTDTGRAAGVASFFRIDPMHGSIEVAAVLFARSLQRTRAATEVVRLLAGYVFESSATAASSGSWTHTTSPRRRLPDGSAFVTRAASATRWPTRAATATPTGSP